MAKLNKGTSVEKELENHPDKTTNYEGGLAFSMDRLSELYTRVVTCLVGEPKFYKEVDAQGNITANNQDSEILKLVKSVATEQPEFILQLASYARNQMNLRTIPQLLLVEASLIDNCKPFVRAYTPDIVKRADEPGECLAYLITRIGHIGSRTPGLMKPAKNQGHTVPKALMKGLRDGIHRFTHFKGEVDAYQLAKYNRDNAAVKMFDVINLIHPKPVSEAESKLFKSVLDKSIASANTWETTLSQWKEKGFESKKAAWEHIIPDMPIMATLRNLRNFLEEGVGEASLSLVQTRLTTPKIIKNSKQFPFRFFSAYRELDNLGGLKNHAEGWKIKLVDALQTAMDISVENLPKLAGTTVIMADSSASMDANISEKSKVQRSEIAMLLMAMSKTMCEESICIVYGEEAAVVNMSKRDGILTNMNKALRTEVGHSTEAWKALHYIRTSKIKADRFINFSDMQCYNASDAPKYGDRQARGSYDHYRESLASEYIHYLREVQDAFMYSVDMAGYGTLQIPQDQPKAAIMAGWSEKMLNFIPAFEADRATAVQYIQKIKPPKHFTVETEDTEESG